MKLKYFYNQNEPSSYYSKEMCQNKGKTENTVLLHFFLRIEFQKLLKEEKI